ncbi:putative regulator PrlF [Burkholderiaceae bacterium]
MEKIGPDDDVMPSRVEITDQDAPVHEQFLSFLSTDLAQHPERLKTIDASLVHRIRSLVGGIDVDLDTALSPTQTPKP